jgi:Dolichyl-phosphate-mannose-protein mannosyltransferase
MMPSTGQPSRSRSLLALTALLLCAFALRVIGINFTELWGDEGFTYVFIKSPLAEMAAKTVQVVEPHPLGSYVLYQGWTAVAGFTPYAIRFPAAWFGVLAVALIYRAARDLRLQRVHSGVPLVAAGLLAINVFAVHYSREMRMYSMLLAGTLVSGILMFRLLRAPHAATLLAYVLASALALHAHYHAGLYLLAQNVFVAGWLLNTVRLHGWPRVLVLLRSWVVAQLLVLGLTAPWLWYARTTFSSYQGNHPDGVTLWGGLNNLLGNYTLGIEAADVHVIGAAAALAAFAIAAWALVGARRWGVALWLALSFTLPFLIGWMLSQGKSTFGARYFIATLAPAVLLIAVAIGAALARMRPARRVGPLVLAALVSIMLFFGLAREFDRYVYGRTREWNEFVALVHRYRGGLSAAEIRPALNLPNPLMTFYYDPYGEYVTLPFKPGDTEGARAVVAQLRQQGVRRVVLKDMPSWWDPSNIAASALAAEYAEVGVDRNRNWTVRIYSRVAPDELQPLGAAYGDAVVLDAALATHEPAAGLLVASVRWRAGAAERSGAEKMFVHVTPLDNAGAVVAQIDLPIGDADLTRPLNTFGIPLPADLPPGRYQVRIGVYDPSQPGAPRLLTTSGADATLLLAFDVP